MFCEQSVFCMCILVINKNLYTGGGPCSPSNRFLELFTGGQRAAWSLSTEMKALDMLCDTHSSLLRESVYTQPALLQRIGLKLAVHITLASDEPADLGRTV